MGRMISATQKVCKKCEYHYGGDNSLTTCDYLLKTGKRRNCPVGVCDKFEPIVGRKEKIPWDDQ